MACFYYFQVGTSDGMNLGTYWFVGVEIGN